MHIFIDNPTLKPKTPAESNLKHHPLTELYLTNRRLYRNADDTYKEPRYVVPESEALDPIINEHLQLLHAGRDKVWAAIQKKYYGTNCQEVIFALKLCKNCTLNGPSATKAPLVPIITGRAWERVQIDLIDMQHEPSRQSKQILHIKDHFNKYTQLYPLKCKNAEPIADALLFSLQRSCPQRSCMQITGRNSKGLS